MVKRQLEQPRVLRQQNRKRVLCQDVEVVAHQLLQYFGRPLCDAVPAAEQWQ